MDKQLSLVGDGEGVHIADTGTADLPIYSDSVVFQGLNSAKNFSVFKLGLGQLLQKISHETFSFFLFYKHRYRLSGLLIPGLKDWFESTFGANLQHKTPATVSVT